MDVVCRSDRVTVEDTYQYDDSANDVFEREPYCVKFVVLSGTGAPALLPFYCIISYTPSWIFK